MPASSMGDSGLSAWTEGSMTLPNVASDPWHAGRVRLGWQTIEDEGGRLRQVSIAVASVGLIAMAAALGSGLRNVGAAADPATPAYYTEQVRPILVQKCGKCHLNVSHKGGLSLETRASTMKGGRDGAVIVPGDPGKSLLIKLIRHEGPANDPKPMPPKSPKISDAEIAIITQWIKAGAVMPNHPPQ